MRNLWSNEQLLNEILLLTYASYVVMLEYRNKVWKYEYMAFARRSGFSSNEKGNTNRLLLVASIYNSLGEIEKTLLFVRQSEDENNHYNILKENLN